MDTSQPQFSHDELVDNLVGKLKAGKMFPLFADETIYMTKPVAKHYSYREFSEAEVLAADKLKAELLKKHKNRRIKLDDEDTSLRVPNEHLDAVERYLKLMVPDEAMDDYNDGLKAAKSAAITHRDVAFIAAVHRDSVLNNGQHNEAFLATSPFRRIAQASIHLKFRSQPFDNRQIRYALSMLSELGFTTETEAANRSQKKDASHAAKWAVCREEPWESFFNKRT